LRSVLVDSWPEVSWVSTESNIHHLQELIHTTDHALWGCAHWLLGWDTLETYNLVGEICCHDEVMLHDESGFLTGKDPSLHNLGGKHSLFGVKISWWLIDKEDVAWLSKSKNDSNSLQLSSRKGLNVIIEKTFNLKWHEHLSFENGWIPWVLELGVKQFLYWTLELWSNSLWLVTYTQFWEFEIFVIWFQYTSKHLDKSSFTCSVLTKHHHNFWRFEWTSLNLELEWSESLNHFWIKVFTFWVLFFTALVVSNHTCDILILSDSKCQLKFSESHVLSWNKSTKENINSLSNGHW